MAFLLAGPAYGYGEATIGLFGLAGVVGAVAATWAGRLADRGRQGAATGGFLAVVVASWPLLAWGGHSLAALLAGIVALDLGVQGNHITSQSLIFGLDPEARSRLTTAYMTATFAGGALAAAAASAAWSAGGWDAVAVLGGAISLAALALWVAEAAVARGDRGTAPSPSG